MSAQQSQSLSPASPSWGRFAGIVLLFMLLGPLVGAVGVNIVLSLMASVNEAVHGNYSDIAKVLAGGIVIGSIVSAFIAYSFGIVSAAGVGIAAAIGDRRKRGVSWTIVLVSATVFWLVMAVLATTVVPPEGVVQWVAGLLVAHLLAAVICGALARRLFGAR